VSGQPVGNDMEAAAERLLEKLRRFISTDLDAHERALLAQLLAPGVAAAHSDDEVAGFGMAAWSTATLPRALVDALHRHGVRVEGLGLS
jgi:hypothetical protein